MKKSNSISAFSKESLLRLEWNILHMQITDIFPYENCFSDSLWAKWLNHLENAVKEETDFLDNLEKDILERQKESSAKINYENDLGDYLADKNYESFSLSNNMYAAIVVSIWSKIEFALKEISSFCNKVFYSEVIKENKFDFGKYKKFFMQKELIIDLESFPSYKKINCIRILNNSFKHNNGIYCPKKNKPYDHIDRFLKNELQITDNEVIDYYNLPIEEFLKDCNVFFNFLIFSIGEKISKKDILKNKRTP